jgi:hypothetical protein
MPIVLQFLDVLPFTFPGNEAVVDNAIQNYGVAYAGDQVAHRTFLVENQDVGVSEATANAYACTRDINTQAMQEISRIRHKADSAAESSSVSVSTLRTVAGTKTLENTLELNNLQSVVISNESGTANENRTAFDYDGVSFSRDDAALYWGALKQFRMRFAAGAGDSGEDVLYLESQDAVDPTTSIEKGIQEKAKGTPCEVQIVVQPGFNIVEWTSMEELQIDGVPVIMLNGSLDKLNSSYYPNLFYPGLAKAKERFFKRFISAYYLKRLPGGWILRAYPEEWQVVSHPRPDESPKVLSTSSDRPNYNDAASALRKAAGR